ncbi:hypothetical protein V8B97DRAFT_1914480 [Scleroderma yunnanense]
MTRTTCSVRLLQSLSLTPGHITYNPSFWNWFSDTHVHHIDIALHLQLGVKHVFTVTLSVLKQVGATNEESIVGLVLFGKKWFPIHASINLAGVVSDTDGVAFVYVQGMGGTLITSTRTVLQAHNNVCTRPRAGQVAAVRLFAIEGSKNLIAWNGNTVCNPTWVISELVDSIPISDTGLPQFLGMYSRYLDLILIAAARASTRTIAAMPYILPDLGSRSMSRTAPFGQPLQ